MADNITSNYIKLHHCKTCDFKCYKLGDWNRHLMTRKHQKTYNGLTNASNLHQITSNYICDCGSVYKHRQSLYKHQKVCYIYHEVSSCSNKQPIPTDILDNNMIKEVLMELVKQKGDESKNMKEMLLEIIPHIKGNAENSYNNTTNNNQFNINMFLNDQCKNAMNLTDFIDSLPITSETYDNTIENGLTKTITNMITNGLNNMNVLERPIHCTDPVRKTMYIKDNNVWEKDKEFIVLLDGIKQLSLKQRTLISKWRDVNEGWQTDDKLQSKMTNLVFNSMTQIESDEKETGKIIRAIGKNTYLTNEIKDEYK